MPDQASLGAKLAAVAERQHAVEAHATKLAAQEAETKERQENVGPAFSFGCIACDVMTS